MTCLLDMAHQIRVTKIVVSSLKLSHWQLATGILVRHSLKQVFDNVLNVPDVRLFVRFVGVDSPCESVDVSVANVVPDADLKSTPPNRQQ